MDGDTRAVSSHDRSRLLMQNAVCTTSLKVQMDLRLDFCFILVLFYCFYFLLWTCLLSLGLEVLSAIALELIRVGRGL